MLREKETWEVLDLSNSNCINNKIQENYLEQSIKHIMQLNINQFNSLTHLDIIHNINIIKGINKYLNKSLLIFHNRKV